jgi:hypothetical protein
MPLVKPPATPPATIFFRPDLSVSSLRALLLCASLVSGTVWSFAATLTQMPTNTIYEWTFDGGTLAPALGKGTLTFADATTANVTTFGSTGGSVPNIGGQPATFMHVPVFNAKSNGYYVRLLESGPNGGGAYINRYSVIMDVLIPGAINWTALFNTDPGNDNDADWYVASDGSLGIAALGYTSSNAIIAGKWYRLAFTADLGAGLATYYTNGTPALERVGGSLLEGRYSLYSTNDNLPSLLLFNEGDTGGNYTHELYVASIAIVDRTLSASEIAALGAPNAEGIFVRHLRINRNGAGAVLTWNGASTLRLQKTATLASPDWQDVPGTLGASSFAEPAFTMNACYRLAWQ